MVPQVTLRRVDTVTNRALFSLAVRMAQIMGLHQDPLNAFPPFETEMRRRLWWHICGLESQGAEEGASRSTSIMDDALVEMPANLNELDLYPGLSDHPESRTGSTDMTFVLLRFELMRVVHAIKNIRKRHATGPSASDEADLKSTQRKFLDESMSRLEKHYLRYLSETRPYDRLCLNLVRAILVRTLFASSWLIAQVGADITDR